MAALAGAILALGFALALIGPAEDAEGRKVSMATKTFKMGGPDQKRRLVVRCPGGRSVPYGGGMKSSPLPGGDGEGAYPHSYERLGVQGGFHVTAVLYDPVHRSTQKRRIQLQVKCGRRLGHTTPPHRTEYVRPGQTKKVVATCPGRRHLIGGGFQRTDFVSRGGNYVTESRAISSRSWRVTASAFGGFGGEITAIAYCIRSKRPLVRAVKASTSISQGGFGAATTPRCPGKRKLIWGGFATDPWGSLFFHNGYFTKRGRWASNAYNNFGPSATLTSYGYCL